MPDTLKALFDPKTIAVIGASNDIHKFGGRPIRYMLEAGFSGQIFPVNRREKEIQGLAAYADIRDIPLPVDLAIISVPARSVVNVIKNCAESRVKSTVIFSSGFSEIGNTGAKWQDQISKISRDSGLRIVGPNCMGMLNVHTKAIGTFTSAFEHGWPKPGNISIVSQSGAVGAHTMVLARERGLGICGWVTTGNECDVDVAACIAYCAEDPKTQVIAAYIEGTRKPDDLLSALDRARFNRKAVFVLKVGGSEVGSIAANSHTASLAGADVIFDAALRQFGAYRVRSLEELLDMSAAAARKKYPTGNRLGIVTISGGVGVMAADAAAENGLDVPELPKTAQKQIREAMSFAAPRNPVDTTAEMLNNMPLFEHCMRIMLAQGECDAILVFLSTTGLSARMMSGYRDVLPKLRAEFPDALIFLSMTCSPENKEFLENCGYLIMEDPTKAVSVISGLLYISNCFKKSSKISLMELPTTARPPTNSIMKEREASFLLSDAGIPMITNLFCSDVESAVSAGESLGHPIVLKVDSPQIIHKFDSGGVRLDLKDNVAIRDAFHEIMKSVNKKAPDADILGVLASPMAGPGVEAIIGVQDDPTFGPVIMFGLGGIHVEVLEDVVFRIAPFDCSEAQKMIDEIRGRKILDGVRGGPRSDTASLAKVISLLSIYANTFRNNITSIDINPVLIRAEGQGVIGLDALVLGKKTA